MSVATKDARDYMASPEALDGILAVGIVTESVLGRNIVNFYMRINLQNKHDYPMTVFNSEN